MDFALICRDAPDARDRRLAIRPAHFEGLKRERRDGYILEGGAILNEAGEMVGSVVLCRFPDRAALDAYLAREPYVQGKVWGEIEILETRFVDWPKLMGE